MGYFTDDDNYTASTHASDLEAKFGDDGKLGNEGENRYAAALGRAGVSDLFTVHRSLSIPTGFGQTQYSGDVDFAVANGDRLLLLDVKAWPSAAGKIYWTLPGLDQTFANFEVVPKLSQNMDLAVDRYTETGAWSSVTAMVVFMPAFVGAPLPRSVRFLIWPGGIRSYLSRESFAEIGQRLGPQRPANVRGDQLLAELRK